MEKATAELDGTIVFNYIDDDIQIVETTVTEKQPTKETKSNTSFDENQNPKAIDEGSVVDKLIKKEKDLIIILENEVLTPIKLEPTEESISAQPQNSTKDANKKIRRKRGRSSDLAKLPKTKKLKTNAKKFKDFKESKNLEDSKPKRGRPKKLMPSVKVNKRIIPKIKIKLKKPKLINKGLKGNKKIVPKIIIKLKCIPKQTKKGIKAKKQYAVIDSSKPKRGRPKKQVLTDATGAEYQVTKSIKKMVLKGKQEAVITGKDVASEKTKKYRSKSLNVSQVELCPANELVSKCMELKQAVTSQDITQTKSGHAVIDFKDLEPPKPKRGRPFGSGRKNLNLSLQLNSVECPKVNEPGSKGIDSKQTLTPIDITKLQSSQALKTPVIVKKQPTSQSRGLWLTKPKKVRSKSLETKKAGAFMVSNANESADKVLENSPTMSNELDTLGDLTEPQISIIKELMAQAEQQIAIIKSKPKRGRPKSLGTKTAISKPEKSEKPTVEPRELKAVIDLTQTQDSKIVKSCSQAEQPTTTNSLGTGQPKTSVKSNTLETSRPKPGRPKSLGSKKGDVSLVSKLAESSKSGKLKNNDISKQLQVPLDLTRPQFSNTKERSAIIDLMPSNPKRSRPQVSEMRKLLYKSAKTKEVMKTGVELKQQDALGNLTKSLPSNTKEIRPRGLEPKYPSSPVLKIKECANKSVSSRHLDALMDLAKSQLSKVNETNLKPKQQNTLVESNDLVQSKPKRGRPKGFRIKKNIISLVNTDPQASTSGKADIDLVTKQLSSSLVISDVGNNKNSSKALTLKALGLESKQTISSHSVTFKGRKLRDKVLLPKRATGTKKTTVEQKPPNSLAKNNIDTLDIKPDITKLTKSLKTSKGRPRLAVSVKKVNIGHPKPKRGRPKGSLNRKINPLALMVRLEPLKLEEIEFRDVGASTSIISTCLGPSQSNIIQNNGVEARKMNVSTTEAQQQSSKCKEVLKKRAGPKQQNTAEEAIDKRVIVKNVQAKSVSFADTTKSLKVSKGLKTKNKDPGEKIPMATVNILDLAAHKGPKAKQGQDKAPKANSSLSADTAKCFNLFKTGNKSLRVTKVDASKKITSSQPTETVGMAKKKNSVVEIVDFQPFRSTAVTSIISKSKKAKTIEPQPSTSTGIVETIDLELCPPRSKIGRGLGVRKINFIGNTKGPAAPHKTVNMENEVNRNLQPSKDKETSGKRKRKDISFCDGNKDFIFPKPKRVKRVLTTNDKSAKPSETVEQSQANSVGSKDIEPPKSQEIVPKLEEQKDNASVDTKEEPSKLLEVGVQSTPKKIMCTVGTQTIEIPDDDIKEDTKISVGTQMLESPKPEEDKNVSAASLVECSLPKADKTSDSEEKIEKIDDTVKTEDILIPSMLQPTVTINLTEGHQEHGVKFESVEQIHTEFKYESQSEHEDLRRRKRGKLGGPMRGRRRRPKEEPTSINSFVRIIDLNGKIQLKCYNQIYKCDHCLYVGNSKANLDRHSLVHRSPDEIIWFQCTECPYRSKYEHQLKSHFLIHLKPEQIHFFQCPHCEAKCSRKHNLANHIRSIHSSREYTFRCAECDYTTFSKERLVAHLRKHSKEVHACTQCKFVTKRLEYLRSHFKMKHLLNAIPRPFPCDTCSYKGKTKRELDKHFDRMHNKDRLHVYHCNHCAFNSIYKKNLEFHLLHMHNNSEGFQKFICGHCQKTFSYKNGLKVHIIRCHLQLPDEEWHKCLECKYKSKDVSTLKRHIKRNHGAPRLHCQLCGFATNRQVSMDAHVKTHEYDNEDILKCPECPYRIIQMSSFLYHMKVIHGKPVTSKDAEQYYMQDEC